MTKPFDFAIIGAGVFGAWTAYCLRQKGARVALLDAYGPANSRASSSGETRIIRMGYGPDELYTEWAKRSLPAWRELFERTGSDLFRPTGVLWLTDRNDPYLRQLEETLSRHSVAAEKLTPREIRRRYPQLAFEEDTAGILEPESGVLLARQSVQLVVKEACRSGVEFYYSAVSAPHSRSQSIMMGAGESISAGTFVFACGPWLPRLFPGLLQSVIQPSRQEVFFLGAPAGSQEFRAGIMPVWLHHNHPDRPYILPDIDQRGVKIALDRHGAAIDPDTDSRLVGDESVKKIRTYIAEHMPALGDAPVLETRVCQYENTANGDFVIDRHPEMENVWIAGGGSGHGFKHGPAVGEYVAGRILNNAPEEPRFLLRNQPVMRKREVF